jgi:hypothetical protein
VMSTALNDYQLLPIFLISLVVILAATELGRWLGVRAGDRGGDQVLTLEGDPRAIGTDDRLYLRHGIVAL